MVTVLRYLVFDSFEFRKDLTWLLRETLFLFFGFTLAAVCVVLVLRCMNEINIMLLSPSFLESEVFRDGGECVIEKVARRKGDCSEVHQILGRAKFDETSSKSIVSIESSEGSLGVC